MPENVQPLTLSDDMGNAARIVSGLESSWSYRRPSGYILSNYGAFPSTPLGQALHASPYGRHAAALPLHLIEHQHQNRNRVAWLHPHPDSRQPQMGVRDLPVFLEAETHLPHIALVLVFGHLREYPYP